MKSMRSTLGSTRTTFSKQLGVSMIEILVTLVVTVVGLMGMTTLQLVGLKNTSNSHQRYQITLLAYDLQERMRANVNAAVAGAYNGTFNDETEVFSGDADSSAEIAEQDTKDWAQAMKNAGIPNFSGTVSSNGNMLYNISVTWSEQDPAIQGADLEQKTFNLAVRL